MHSENAYRVENKMIEVGAGDYRYRFVENWASLPEGMEFTEVSDVVSDSRGRVYLFDRGSDVPVKVFEADGTFVDGWGQGVFTTPHGMNIDANDDIYCTDVGDHTVRKFSGDGKLLMQIGKKGEPAPYLSGEPFNKPTHTATAPGGEIYVCDGYGNARIHKYTPDGRLLLSWGEPGSGPGQFCGPHNVGCDDDGWVYVCDRDNHRIQVFDPNGRYETFWPFFYRPQALHVGRGRTPVFFVGECGNSAPSTRDWPNLGPRVSIVAADGTVIVKLADTGPGNELGKFITPHGIAIDVAGNIYVGDVARQGWRYLFPNTPMPEKLRTFHKLERIAA